MAGRGQEEAERLRTQVANLGAALDNRDVIGQAKGILMERHGIDAEEAFRRLVGISQTTNTKLHEVAAQVAGADGDGDGHLPKADGPDQLVD